MSWIPFELASTRKGGKHGLEEGLEIHRLVLELGLAGLELGEIEQSIDEAQQAVAGAVHGLEIGADRGRDVGHLQRVLEREQHQRKRGPQLVVDVVEELRLEPVELVGAIEGHLELSLGLGELAGPERDPLLQIPGLMARMVLKARLLLGGDGQVRDQPLQRRPGRGTRSRCGSPTISPRSPSSGRLQKLEAVRVGWVERKRVRIAAAFGFCSSSAPTTSGRSKFEIAATSSVLSGRSVK